MDYYIEFNVKVYNYTLIILIVKTFGHSCGVVTPLLSIRLLLKRDDINIVNNVSFRHRKN